MLDQSRMCLLFDALISPSSVLKLSVQDYNRQLVCKCVCVRARVCVLSRVRFSGNPWTVDRQAPLSMEFSRQNYWNGLPFPTTSGNLPDPGIEPRLSCLLHWQADSTTASFGPKVRIFFIFVLKFLSIIRNDLFTKMTK